MKRSLIIGACVAGWLGCGVISAGYENGYFRQRFHRLFQDRDKARGSQIDSFTLVPFGPPGLVISVPFHLITKSPWTLTGEPFPCEEGEFADIWCKGNLPTGAAK